MEGRCESDVKWVLKKGKIFFLNIFVDNSGIIRVSRSDEVLKFEFLERNLNKL